MDYRGENVQATEHSCHHKEGSGYGRQMLWEVLKDVECTKGNGERSQNDGLGGAKKRASGWIDGVYFVVYLLNIH